MDKRSQLKCLGDCKDFLSKGCSVLFFPEGTRSKDGKMAEFKKVTSNVCHCWAPQVYEASRRTCQALLVECLSNSAMPYQVASMRHEESSWLLISAWCSFSALSMHSSLVLDTGLALPCPAV